MLIVNFECGTCNFKFIRECPNGIIDFTCPQCSDEKVKNGKYDKRSKEYLRKVKRKAKTVSSTSKSKTSKHISKRKTKRKTKIN